MSRVARRFLGSDLVALLEVSESPRAAWQDGAKVMNLKQRLQQRDLWLHLEFNVALAIVVVVTLLGYVASKFGG
jgi:hypothetical protein